MIYKLSEAHLSQTSTFSTNSSYQYQQQTNNNPHINTFA